LVKEYPEITYEIADVGNFAELSQAFNKILNKYLKIDFLINNTGVWIQGNVKENNSKEIYEAVQ